MTKFKIGDRVKIVSAPQKCEGHELGDVGTIRHVGYQYDGIDYDYGVDVDGNLGAYDHDELSLVKENPMKYKQGDTIQNHYGERKVLGVCGEVYFMSMQDEFSKVGSSFTQDELDEDGYMLVTDEKPETHELTIDEIAEKFNLDPEQIRIKKES